MWKQRKKVPNREIKHRLVKYMQGEEKKVTFHNVRGLNGECGRERVRQVVNGTFVQSASITAKARETY